MVSCVALNVCLVGMKSEMGVSDTGEMPERSKGAVLKTAERKFRGFESLSLRWLCPRCFACTRM